MLQRWKGTNFSFQILFTQILAVNSQWFSFWEWAIWQISPSQAVNTSDVITVVAMAIWNVIMIVQLLKIWDSLLNLIKLLATNLATKFPNVDTFDYICSITPADRLQ